MLLFTDRTNDFLVHKFFQVVFDHSMARFHSKEKKDALVWPVTAGSNFTSGCSSAAGFGLILLDR